MARTLLTAVFIVSLNVLVGCYPANSGRAQILPSAIYPSVPAVEVKSISQTKIVEQVAFHRQAYRQGIEKLVKYYSETGNQMKLRWAKKELAGLSTIPQYNYIIEASVAGPKLRARNSIPEADSLFREAVDSEKAAGPLTFLKNENFLRLALAKYNQVISKHPSSDKIDDAAYKAGGICEYFKDYNIALLYYRRTYQWDPSTPYPAGFREAYILDKCLHERAEALDAYQRALKSVKTRGEHRRWVEFAEKRVAQLTKSEQKTR